MVRFFRWLHRNQARLRWPATLAWLACTVPVVVVTLLNDPHVAGMVAATYLGPVVLAQVPPGRWRPACWAYATVWAFCAGFAVSPGG